VSDRIPPRLTPAHAGPIGYGLGFWIEPGELNGEGEQLFVIPASGLYQSCWKWESHSPCAAEVWTLLAV
jgi:hypothetical protein